MTKVLTSDARSIRIKGRSFLAVVLSPDLPFDDWLTRLDDLAARSAGFFLARPVVLDVTGLKIEQAELKALIAALTERNVSVMSIEGARHSILGPGMPPAIKGGRPVSDEAVTREPAVEQRQAAETASADEKPVTAEARPALQSLIIREPVRSGQSVMFPEGDVTIIGSVASGAEVIAGGSIHIYGALRGRAMAGSLGNASAQIFCRKLEAELIAIDGIYKMADDMEPSLHGQPVQLWLQGETIIAETLI